jgi:hypothetical protein
MGVAVSVRGEVGPGYQPAERGRESASARLAGAGRPWVMKGRRMKQRGRELFSFFFLYSKIPFSNPFLKIVLNHFKF